MEKFTIETSSLPELNIEQVHGNLDIKGWDQSGIVVYANPDDINLDEQDDGVDLSCHGNCEIRLPHSTSIQIDQVHGNMAAKLLDDQLQIAHVHGSLHLRSVGAVQIDQIDGEFSAKGVSGDLRIATVNGNASVRNAYEGCFIEDIHGNLDLHNVEGALRASADGNARIRLAMMLGEAYEINAKGNVQCRIPEDVNIALDLASEGQIIKLKLPDEKRTCRESHCSLTLGDGDIPVKISAGGAIHLSTQDAEWAEAERDVDEDAFSGLSDDFGEHIAQQVETQIQSQMDEMMRQMNEQMAELNEKISQAGLSPEQIEHIMQQARKTSERETTRAQEKMRRAQEKLERKLEAARRKEEMKARSRGRQTTGKRSWNFEFPTPPSQPVQETVSDEERLMILRMLEQKKISMEEAEQLLEALEGKA